MPALWDDERRLAQDAAEIECRRLATRAQRGEVGGGFVEDGVVASEFDP